MNRAPSRRYRASVSIVMPSKIDGVLLKSALSKNQLVQLILMDGWRVVTSDCYTLAKVWSNSVIVLQIHCCIEFDVNKNPTWSFVYRSVRLSASITHKA